MLSTYLHTITQDWEDNLVEKYYMNVITRVWILVTHVKYWQAWWTTYNVSTQEQRVVVPGQAAYVVKPNL